MAKRQIRLTEDRLRNFISYSVAKILKEGYEEPVYNQDGNFSGRDREKYGSNTVKIDFDPRESDDMELAVACIIDEHKYPELSLDMFLEGGQFENIWPVSIDVDYNINRGMKGDNYLQPDDPDEIEVTGWEVSNPGSLNIPGNLKQFVKDVLDCYTEDENLILGHIEDNETGLYEENRGATIHFGGDTEPYKPETPYGNMTWNEYKEKRQEEGEKENRGIATHFDGSNHEETPEEKERAGHMFDDDYWVSKMNLTKEDLAEMVSKSVRLIAERINLNEISKGLLDRAREAAHKDMMRNFGDSKIRSKRERQWKKFGDEYGSMDQEEKDSICPQVDERDLVNMPEGTYVVLNGGGRDAVNADFKTSYSGRAGTKEQCEEYVKRFYDMGANWEHLPEILPLEDYLNGKRGQ